MATPYYLHSPSRPPSWAAGLYRLDSLRVGEQFWTPGGRRGVVLLSVDEHGKVFIAVPSIDYEGPARGELLVRPSWRAA